MLRHGSDCIYWNNIYTAQGSTMLQHEFAEKYEYRIPRSNRPKIQTMREKNIGIFLSFKGGGIQCRRCFHEEDS